MATISFKEELVLNNTTKISEIAKGLKQPRDPQIQSAQPPQLPKNAGSIWFKHSEK